MVGSHELHESLVTVRAFLRLALHDVALKVVLILLLRLDQAGFLFIGDQLLVVPLPNWTLFPRRWEH